MIKNMQLHLSFLHWLFSVAKMGKNIYTIFRNVFKKVLSNYLQSLENHGDNFWNLGNIALSQPPAPTWVVSLCQTPR